MSQVFSDSVTDCIDPLFPWTPINIPFGLPRFNIALFDVAFAGIDFVLGFPPVEFPTIDIFVDAYLAALAFPCNHAEVTFGLVTIPEKTDGIECGFDISGALAFIALNIQIVFELFTAFITDFPTIPSVSFVIDLYLDLAIEFGISGPAITGYAGCAATAIVDLITAEV